jgi:predicted metal-dependent peptidase
MDYVVNGTLEAMDTDPDKFLERPTSVPPLVNPKYSGMSVPEVIRELLKEKEEGGGGGKGKPIDVHDFVERTPENDVELDELDIKISDAVRHGEILQGQLQAARGESAGNVSLTGFRERPTDWRPYFRRFFQEMCEGDDQSRFSPPNKRLLPMDIIMPSRFSEAMGEIIIASDTSGSMYGILPVVFGEVARICQTIKPSQVRVLWWDTRIAGEQVFKIGEYDNIAKCMAPKGGGGTTVSCVAAYLKEKKYKYKAVIMLTDGYIEAVYTVPEGNVLWGVLDNTNFTPRRGKVLHINSEV